MYYQCTVQMEVAQVHAFKHACMHTLVSFPVFFVIIIEIIVYPHACKIVASLYGSQ